MESAFAKTWQEVPEDCPIQENAASAFELSKLIGEQYVRYYAKQRGVRACIFRMSAVFGRPTEGNENGFVTHYVESVKHRWPIRLPEGVDPVRDILYVMKVCDVSGDVDSFATCLVDFFRHAAKCLFTSRVQHDSRATLCRHSRG